MTTNVSLDAARRLMLATMGLASPPSRPATKAAVRAAIRHMSVLQIDTIHVVARSPYVVLWSRLGDYEPRWLEELLAEGALFEYWSHEACFLPIETYPLYRRLMLDGRKGFRSTPRYMEEHADQVGYFLQQIRERGPVKSADFQRTDGRKGTWWDWKPEKIMLEHLHSAGSLMIAARRNFHRIYDLRERVLPGWDDRDAPPLDSVLRTMALEAVRALGVATAKWAADYFRMPKAEVAGLLAGLAEEGELRQVSLEGSKAPAYVHPKNAKLLSAAVAGKIESTLTTLLSPFDPLVWDRDRASGLFNFDYRIECYTPGPKRRYGYFTLPILHRGALVGRLDPKAHRSDGVFEVKALHLEPGVSMTEPLATDLAAALSRFAAWHGTPRVVVIESDPPAAAKKLTAAIRKVGRGA